MPHSLSAKMERKEKEESKMHVTLVKITMQLTEEMSAKYKENRL